ncbi:MAG: 2-isopropylmalate synthase [Candidatus Micrarchaeota archaeon]|nr:2-isopropylmalate synthase [Candidatus Micrarchaeota archaeon]MDE1847862.1 2-isopropylmalate synthase [Candidatus Micrarchaeota archaeon]MDE1864189.1 2-isopropylmalate synthase [Candidatus Micrarchaeota archaeon]
MKARKIRIFDTTLRDGEQTPGVALRPEQKLQIAQMLNRLGVNAIEAGFPAISEGEKKGVGLIAKAGLAAQIYGLARAEKSDIDACVKVGVGSVHTFIATSDLHLKFKLKMTREQVLEKAVEAVSYAKSLGLDVEFSAEDATRSDREFLRQVYKAVAEVGADRVNIPDTVGTASPQEISSITKDVVGITSLPVSIHCHNDFGWAVANSVAALEAGAQSVHVTINGIGERAGNTSLEELAASLAYLNFNEKYETSIALNRIYETSIFVSNLVGIRPQPNKAIVGDNAFAHESGIHTHGVLSNPLTYEPIKPEDVGRSRTYYAGKHAGAHGVSAMLGEYGIAPDREQAKLILDQVKTIGDAGGRVTEVELLEIAGKVMSLRQFERMVHLTGFSVTTGIGNNPYAFVKLNIGGKDYVGTSDGVGPVDAALKAIKNVTGAWDNTFKIKDYRIGAVSGGSEAMCEVTVEVEDGGGSSAVAKSKGYDIVITSVQAMLEAINRAMLKKELKSIRQNV